MKIKGLEFVMDYQSFANIFTEKLDIKQSLELIEDDVENMCKYLFNSQMNFL